jgi:PEGA domain-containing protein
MEDTDQMMRVTTPFVRPGLDSIESLGQLDRTPTTAPGNTPGTPRRRLARGTRSPSNELLLLPPPALPVRLIDPPRAWSYRIRIDMDEELGTLPAVSGEIDTAPVRRIGETPWALIATAVVAAAVMASAAWVVLSSGSTDSKTAVAPEVAPVAAAIQQTVVTPLPSEPADEIEMPAQDIAPALETPTALEAPAANHATLMIGSKPPCRILIDGKDTGLTTPNRAVRVPAGRHTITLVNEEHDIRYSEQLTITGGRKAKMIRNLL